MTYYLISTFFVYLLAVAIEGYDHKFSSVISLVDKLGVRKIMKKYFSILNTVFLKKAFFQGILGVIILLIITVIFVGIVLGIIRGVFGELTLGIAQFILMFIILSYRYTKKDEAEYVVTVHERSFGILFWFIMLNWSGALFYWLLVAMKKDSDILAEKGADKIKESITKLHGFAAWLPARITGIFYAFAGNFRAGFKPWFESMKNFSMPSSKVLENCGHASFDEKAQDEIESLVKRTLIIWVCVGIIASFFGKLLAM